MEAKLRMRKPLEHTTAALNPGLPRQLHYHKPGFVSSSVTCRVPSGSAQQPTRSSQCRGHESPWSAACHLAEVGAPAHRVLGDAPRAVDGWSTSHRLVPTGTRDSAFATELGS